MTKPDFSQLYKDEISKLAKKYKTTNTEIVNIYYTQFKLIQDQMRRDYKIPFEERASIKVIGLGTFVFYPKIAKRIQKEYGKEQERIS